MPGSENIPVVEPAPAVNAAETVHLRRIAQLRKDGLGDFFVAADGSKVCVFPSEEMPHPPPLLRSPGFKKEFGKFHARLGGRLPPSGFYRFENVYVGQSGTLISEDRQILWSVDLISAYWMRFLSRMIMRDVFGLTEDAAGALPSSSLFGRFMARQDVLVQEIESDVTLVCLMKPGSVVYGHWILDTFPMIWHLRQCVEAGALKGPFRYLVSKGVESWVLEKLDMLFGITEKDIIFVDEATTIIRVREIIVPSMLRASPLISPRLNAFSDYVLSRVLPHFMGDYSDLPRRVYISRRSYENLNNRVLLNNAELIEALGAAGVSAIQPETMSWPTQLALFSRADLIVGEFGSGMHNSLFSLSTTRSLVLSHMKRNWNQSSIAALRRQSVAYVQPQEEQRTGIGLGVTYRFAPDVVVDLARELRGSSAG